MHTICSKFISENSSASILCSHLFFCPLHSIINGEQHEKHLYNQSSQYINTKDLLIRRCYQLSIRYIITLCFQLFWTCCVAIQARNNVKIVSASNAASKSYTEVTMLIPLIVISIICASGGRNGYIQSKQRFVAVDGNAHLCIKQFWTVKIKPVALAIIELCLSEGFRYYLVSL